MITKAYLRKHFAAARGRKSFRLAADDPQKAIFDLATKVRDSNKDPVNALLDLSPLGSVCHDILFDGVELLDGRDIRIRAARFVPSFFSHHGVHFDQSKRHPPAIKLSQTTIDRFGLRCVLGQHCGNGMPYRGYLELDHKRPLEVINVTSALARFGRLFDTWLDRRTKHENGPDKSQVKGASLQAPAVLGSLMSMAALDEMVLQCDNIELFFLNGIYPFVSNDAIRYYAIMRAKQEWPANDAQFSDLGFLYEAVYGRFQIALISDPNTARRFIVRFARSNMGCGILDYAKYELNQRTATYFQCSADELTEPEILQYLSKSCFIMPEHLGLFMDSFYCPSH
ncbi:MAG: hypothetical protein ACP5N9_03355 [Candidatus Bilamarchaeum sp.]|jgi:hypothetical protein